MLCAKGTDGPAGRTLSILKKPFLSNMRVIAVCSGSGTGMVIIQLATRSSQHSQAWVRMAEETGRHSHPAKAYVIGRSWGRRVGKRDVMGRGSTARRGSGWRTGPDATPARRRPRGEGRSKRGARAVIWLVSTAGRG